MQTSRGLTSSQESIEDVATGIYVGTRESKLVRHNIIMGIDIGPTNSRVSVYEKYERKIVENAEGVGATKRDIPKIVENAEGVGGLIPSTVAFNENGEVVVGEIAKSDFALGGTKRIIGIPFGDGFIRREIRRVSYKIVMGHHGEACMEYNGHPYLPVQIGSYLINKMKEMTDTYLGKKATAAVLSVPTYYSHDQRKAYKCAGELAGLDVLAVIEEPIAAAMSCVGLTDDAGPVVIVDIGGTSLDVSVVTLYGGVFKLKATTSDMFLGGENFDNVFIQFILAELKKSNIDVTGKKGALTRIRELAEKLKVELSSASQTTISLPFIDDLHHFSLELTRSMYEDIISELVDRVKSTLSYWVKDAALDVEKLKTLVVVGGTTNIPIVREKIVDVFERAPFEGVNINHAVAIGAARFGDKYCRDGNYVCSLTPSLCGEDLGSFFTRFESYLLSTYTVSQYPGLEKLFMKVLKHAKGFYYWCESKVLSIIQVIIAVAALFFGFLSFVSGHVFDILKEKIPNLFSSDVENLKSKVEIVEISCSDVDMPSKEPDENAEIIHFEEPYKTGEGWIGVWRAASIGVIVGGVLVAYLKKD